MLKKRILIVSASFYPANTPRAFRTTELAKEFARQGHMVKVLIPRDGLVHDRFEEEYGIEIGDLGTPGWKIVPIKGKGPVRLLRRAIVRFAKLLFEYPNIEYKGMVKRALKKESGYDLLVSIAVPHPIHWGVAAVDPKSRKVCRTWVADCGDPYVGQENDTFKVPFYFAFVEKWFMRKADYITVPTAGAISAYFPEFHGKIHVISQGFRFEDYQYSSEESDHPSPRFAYAGGFIQGRRDPSELLEYLHGQEKDFEFHIFTNTPQLVEKAVNGSDSRIVLHDPVPRDELLKMLSTMDFMVNFENVGTRQTPSKLIDYLILKKPILSIKTGALNKEIVEEFLSGNYTRQLVIDDPEQYRIENVCNKFMQLIS
jgi:hypothetical protein